MIFRHNYDGAPQLLDVHINISDKSNLSFAYELAHYYIDFTQRDLNLEELVIEEYSYFSQGMFLLATGQDVRPDKGLYHGLRIAYSLDHNSYALFIQSAYWNRPLVLEITSDLKLENAIEIVNKVKQYNDMYDKCKVSFEEFAFALESKYKNKEKEQAK